MTRDRARPGGVRRPEGLDPELRTHREDHANPRAGDDAPEALAVQQAAAQRIPRLVADSSPQPE
jgi:hypothetical protein